MAWPTIFKFLGFGALFAADAIKTENARIKAQNIPVEPSKQPTQFGFPEYMRPCDHTGRRLTDEEIIDNSIKSAKTMIEYCDEQIRIHTNMRESALANGQQSYANTLSHQIKQYEISRHAYVRELKKWSK